MPFLSCPFSRVEYLRSSKLMKVHLDGFLHSEYFQEECSCYREFNKIRRHYYPGSFCHTPSSVQRGFRDLGRIRVSSVERVQYTGKTILFVRLDTAAWLIVVFRINGPKWLPSNVTLCCRWLTIHNAARLWVGYVSSFESQHIS